jgi:hypothetical protein
MEDRIVAKVIEFYIPTNFAKRVKWVPSQQRGKVIEFCLPTKKSAWIEAGADRRGFSMPSPTAITSPISESCTKAGMGSGRRTHAEEADIRISPQDIGLKIPSKRFDSQRCWIGFGRGR